MNHIFCCPAKFQGSLLRREQRFDGHAQRLRQAGDLEIRDRADALLGYENFVK